MAAIKLHAYTGPNDGADSCDFRGDKFVGSAQGDEHATLFEVDPATDEQVELALSEGPNLNKLLSAIGLGAAMPILHLTSGLGGGRAGLRIGVWDE